MLCTGCKWSTYSYRSCHWQGTRWLVIHGLVVLCVMFLSFLSVELMVHGMQILGKVDVMINDTHSYLISQMNRGSLKNRIIFFFYCCRHQKSLLLLLWGILFVILHWWLAQQISLIGAIWFLVLFPSLFLFLKLILKLISDRLHLDEDCSLVLATRLLLIFR